MISKKYYFFVKNESISNTLIIFIMNISHNTICNLKFEGLMCVVIKNYFS